MGSRKKLKLNIKFDNKGKVECAKSPSLCYECKDVKACETINTYYYPFQGIGECFRNNERRR